MRTRLALLVLLLSQAAQARAFAPAPVLRAGDRELALNGVGQQEVLFFKLYRVALYLEHPTRSAEEALSSEQVKRLHLRVLRDLPRERVVRALESGIARAAPAGARALAPRLSLLTAKLRDVKKHEELSLTYYPKRGTVLETAEGEQAVIPGKDFADALFGIWLGENTDAPKVRRALLDG